MTKGQVLEKMSKDMQMRNWLLVNKNRNVENFANKNLQKSIDILGLYLYNRQRE